MPSSVVDRVAGLNVEGNGLARQGLHEDLHRRCKCRIELLRVLRGTRSPAHAWAESIMRSIVRVLGLGSVQLSKSIRMLSLLHL